ncbi:MAG: hypothetical protein K6T65_03310 [Peptococcaceae bacterium]|nr:hypothetical protein [Peptococcaceae bacterium]
MTRKLSIDRKECVDLSVRSGMKPEEVERLAFNVVAQLARENLSFEAAAEVLEAAGVILGTCRFILPESLSPIFIRGRNISRG